jgi:hypothetical protein
MNGYAADKDQRRVHRIARRVDEDVSGLVLLDDHVTHCLTEVLAHSSQVAEGKTREASAAVTRTVG